jgi:hypothetical protein
MTHDTTLAALQAAGLHAEHLKREHELRRATYKDNPAGWHGINDIETLIGLGGHFQWYEAGVLRQMTLTFDPAKQGIQGHYALVSASGKESGTFWSTPNNPAIGWAYLLLEPSGGASRPLIFSGMLTDANWKVLVALLNEVGPSGPIEPAFPIVRA